MDSILQELAPAAELQELAAGAVEKLRQLLLAMPPQERSCDLVGSFSEALGCLIEVRKASERFEFTRSAHRACHANTLPVFAEASKDFSSVVCELGGWTGMWNSHRNVCHC